MKDLFYDILKFSKKCNIWVVGGKISSFVVITSAILRKKKGEQFMLNKNNDFATF